MNDPPKIVYRSTQEQERFKGRDRSEYPQIAKDIINDKFNGKVVGIDNKMFVNGQGRNEFTNPVKHIEGDIYEAKMRTAGELDNLLDAGTNFRNEPDGRDGHIHPDVVGGFDYFDTLFKIGDNYYEAVINIKNVAKGKLFKDVTKIKDVTQDVMSSYGQSPKSQFLRTSSTDSIPQSTEKSSDSQGRELSLEERLSGDALLDAQDLIAEIENVAEVSENGYVTVYHRTTADKLNDPPKIVYRSTNILLPYTSNKNTTQSVTTGGIYNCIFFISSSNIASAISSISGVISESMPPSSITRYSFSIYLQPFHFKQISCLI